MGTPWTAVFPLFSIAIPLHAAEPSDSTARSLGEVEVTARAAAPRIDDRGAIVIGAGAIREGMRTMGEPDAIRYLKMMPGVTSGGDYASGMSIEGSDYSQTLYRLGGAPVFFPYHFGGIFSTFNTPHFSKVSLEKGIHDSSFPNRLGGLVAFDTPTAAADELSGCANVGMLASSATVRVPIVEGLSATLSGRVSYIDAIYRGMLRTDDTDTRYNLYDLNLTVNYAPTRRDRVTLNGFYNSDHLRFDDTNYSLDTRMQWHNALASVAWSHTGRINQSHTIYYSEMGNRLSLIMPQFTVKVPSSIRQGAVHGEMATALGRRFTPLKWGYACEVSSITPQSAEVTGYGDGVTPLAEGRTAVESRLFAETGYRLSQKVTLNAGVKATWWANHGYHHATVDPHLTATWRHGPGTLAVNAAILHQYLHQVGFSDIGMASNFWIGATAAIPPQRSIGASASYTYRLHGDIADVTVDAYYRRVSHQPEYDGFILSLLDSDYDAARYISCGDGYNTGFGIMARKNVGHLTGWVSYAYAIGRRRFADDPTRYVTSANETRHSLTATANYRFNRHWDCSATFAYASGRPVTPVTALYFIGENLITVRGERNSSRLPAYHRLDLGGSYRFTTGKRHHLAHCVSLSVINAYGHRNVEISSFVFDAKTGLYRQKNVASLYRFLPSISYSIDF